MRKFERLVVAVALGAFSGVLVNSSLGQPFSAGVAAGDVTDTSVVLWTRADTPGDIRLQLATNEGFDPVLRTFVSAAGAESDLTVSVAVDSLTAATDYVYRFVGKDDASAVSDTGRFRTAPAPASPAEFRFVFSGDSNFAFAPLTIMGRAAQEDASLFIWFGDTIYGDVPSGDLGVAMTLDDYRAKYRQIRSDPNVRALLNRMAVIASWDDHEDRNDYAGLDPAFPANQRDAAYRAFFEYMPLRPQNVPGDPFRVYRRFSYGSVAEFFLLDERQYREASAQDACGSNPDPLGFLAGGLTLDAACRDLLSAPREMLGREQFDWLTTALSSSTAPVKFILNEVPLTFIGVYPYDRWDGYDAERRELLEFIDAHQITGVVFLTTDTHANAHNVDLGNYFRKWRPEYRLDNRVPMPELIVGPLGTGTLHQELVTNAADLLGLPRSPLTELLLGTAEDLLISRLRNVDDLAFIDDNRFAYAVLHVTLEGKVDVTYRGMDPDRAQQPDAPLRDLYAAQVSPPQPPVLPIPCFLPVLAAGGAAWFVLRGCQPYQNPERKRRARSPESSHLGCP